MFVGGCKFQIAHDRKNTIFQWKRRYFIYFARHVSGITLIRYAQGQQIRKTNKFCKKWEQYKCISKRPKEDSQHRQLWLREENISFDNNEHYLGTINYNNKYWKLLIRVLELDFCADKFLVLTRRNSNSHHRYTATSIA